MIKEYLSERTYRFLPALIFLAFLLLYALSACPTVPPYRDSGELITSSATLGIAHSPGYPLYMIAGNIFIQAGGLVGLSPAYSLNLLSAAAAALAGVFFFLTAFRFTGSRTAGFLAAVIISFAGVNWHLGLVAEMYSLNLLFIAVLLYLMLSGRFYLFAFLSGLSLGNHLTIIFVLIPMTVWVLIYGRMKKSLIRFAGLFAAGLSVYLYLPLRASVPAFLNWGDPSSLKGFLDVISRASYGHTLDLISREVTLDQVIIPQINVYLKNLLGGLTAAGLLLVSAGVYDVYRNEDKRGRMFFLCLAVILILTGPVFIIMSKMPANPHSLAIIEVGYMPSIAVLALFAARGLSYLLSISGRRTAFIMGTAAFFPVLLSAGKTVKSVNLRNNYFAEDYAANILNSLPRNSTVLLRKDHTLFSLWYLRDIESVREDISVLSKGLLSASWYRSKIKRDNKDLKIPPVFESDSSYVRKLILMNPDKDFYMSPSALSEMDPSFFNESRLATYGLVVKIMKSDEEYKTSAFLKDALENYRFRGDYSTDGHQDFFTRDIIGQYSIFYNRYGLDFLKRKEYSRASLMFERAISVDPYNSEPYAGKAYAVLMEGEVRQAADLYREALRMVDRKIETYTRKEYFYREKAEYLNNLGTVYERLMTEDKKDGYFYRAEKSYREAVRLMPSYVQAHYNLGVLYWKKREWRRAMKSFSRALSLEPGNRRLKELINAARSNLIKSE